MPLYEYECRACQRRIEKIQKFSDPELTVCPHCGGAPERTLTAPAVHFAGSGWHKDLYSSAKPAATKNGDGASSTAAAASSSGDGASSAAPAAPAAAAAAPATSSASTAKS